MGNDDPAQAEGGQVSPETVAAVRQIIADATGLKRLLDDLHPAEGDTTPLRVLAAAISLSGHARVEAARGDAEMARSEAETKRLEKQLAHSEQPIPAFVRNTGLSLERLANSAAERYPYGWHLRFQIPAELLEKDPEKASKTNRSWWIAGEVMITLLAAVLIGLVAVEDSHRNHLTSSTAGVAAVVGGWLAVALLPALAWVGLVRWRSSKCVSIDLARQAPAAWVLAGVPGGTAAPEGGVGVPGAAPTQAASTDQSRSQPSDGAPSATSSGSLASREPVLLGSLLTGGGTLALGLSGALGTSALAAVSAGAIAAAGLLVRELVTPANPSSKK